ncbi:MAG: putative zinc-binding metallopeptidase [Deltaproteobacteria bacterium]|nr:putative zinc-binding metallopeptidase [Deltaproteobacteria bacterium]
MTLEWTHLSDEKLLELRFCDVEGLKIEGSELEPRIQKLFSECEMKDLDFRPDFYISDEWFSPEDTVLVAIPFYLFHPRLKQLEHNMMLEVEGGSDEECMKFLRHETGHSFSHAYQIQRKRKYQKLFGLSSTEYEPESYTPKPYSKNFVQHLDNYYAQSHPDEDWAETFAVWLTPGLDWRKKYQSWPKTLEKILFVEEVMQEVAHKKPKITDKVYVDNYIKLKLKLKTHYRRKKELYEWDFPSSYDQELERLFSKDSAPSKVKAEVFLRKHSKELRDVVATWTREKKFTISKVIQNLKERSGELNLYVNKNEEQAKMEVISCVTNFVTNYKFTGKFKPRI